MTTFDRDKENSLSKVDLSRKGSIDTEILPLVSLLNNSKDYFTTSSCSGRVVVFEEATLQGTVEEKIVQKKGCKWLYTTHERTALHQVRECLENICGDAIFKFEPFVIHVQCRELKHAQALLSSAVASGFRNSGISIGNKGKIIVAVRSTHSLEVPLSKNGILLVSENYIEAIVEIANKKMDENVKRIKRFYDNTCLTISKLVNEHAASSDGNLGHTEKRKVKDKTFNENVNVIGLDKSEKICGLEDDLADCCLFDSIT